MVDISIAIFTGYVLFCVVVTTAALGYFAYRGVREHLREVGR